MVSGCEFLEVASIGRFCSIATGVVIGQPRRSHPMHWLSTHAFTANPKLLRKPLQPEREATPARIGHDVWIGRDALILDGVEIGTGAVIGAQSLVNRDVPPYAVVAGSPARVLRYRFAPELIERLLASRWWELPLDVLGELPLDDPQACVEATVEQGFAENVHATGIQEIGRASTVNRPLAVTKPRNGKSRPSTGHRR